MNISDENVIFDRFMIQEDSLDGQRVRSFEILVNIKKMVSTIVIGHKRIIILDKLE